MSVLYYAAAALLAVISAALATAFVKGILWPAVIYIITYFREGREAAEEKALDKMGESKVSYGIKGAVLLSRATTYRFPRPESSDLRAYFPGRRVWSTES